MGRPSATHYLVRVGAMGHIGWFRAVDSVRYARHSRVIVRTTRGLEMGQVVGSPASAVATTDDGVLLRSMTIEDRLLAARLEENRLEAFEACAAALAERSLDAVLIDAEHLFDGRNLYFYFLGDVPEEVESLTAHLATLYESRVELQRFTEALNEGCGPGCGVDTASGGRCAGCASPCSVGSVP